MTAALCPQLAALEVLFPKFVDLAIPAMRATMSFEATPENVAVFILPWGGWEKNQTPPVRSILAACQALDDPEALLSALFTLASAAEALEEWEYFTTTLPVFIKGHPTPFIVPLVMDGVLGMTVPEQRPVNEAEAILWLMAVSLRRCAKESGVIA